MFRPTRILGTVLVFVGMFVPSVARAADFKLAVIPFEERREIKFPMLTTDRIPGAQMKAEVRIQAGQTRLTVEYSKMKPAVLFGGDVTCYVLWAVTRDRGAENLGELWVRPEKDSDKLLFTTGLRNFALLVTAEPYYQVRKPSELVIFSNSSTPDPPVPTEDLVYSDFSSPPETAQPNLGFVRYDGKTPLDVLQAEKVKEIAERLEAPKYAPDVFREADIALQQASVMVRNKAQKGAQDFARRSVASSNDAIKITLRAKDAEALEARIAQRQAEMDSLEAKLSQAEERGRQAEEKGRRAEEAVQKANTELARINQEKTQLDQNLASLRRERSDLDANLASASRELEALSAEKARIERDKAELETRLQGALSQVADTRASARGTIVNLPDILFDVNQATLKPEAQVVIAKLAGILLIMQDLNLRVEGHTDSTGTAEHNLTLSEKRAQSVVDFLRSQGVADTRMVSVGYGLDRPIADNATAEGRRKNRRVEIVIAEGVVQEEVR